MMRNKMEKEIMNYWDSLYSGLSKSKNLFKQVAYRQIPKSKLEKLAFHIKEKLKLKKADKLLDVGCGNLHISSKIHKYVDFSVGADLNFPLLLKAKKLKRTKLVQCEAAYLPFKDGYFDRVLCYNLFQYFPSKKYAKKVINELIRVTKKQGIIMIGDVPYKPQRPASNDLIEFLNSIFLPPIRLLYQFLKYKILRFKKPISMLYYDKSFFKGFGISKPFPMNKYSYKYRFDCVLKK